MASEGRRQALGPQDCGPCRNDFTTTALMIPRDSEQAPHFTADHDIMFTARVSRTALPAFRRTTQRRLQSTAQDNAFNRERQAVKDHAAATSGMLRGFGMYSHADCANNPSSRHLAQAFHLVCPRQIPPCPPNRRLHLAAHPRTTKLTMRAVW